MLLLAQHVLNCMLQLAQAHLTMPACIYLTPPVRGLLYKSREEDYNICTLITPALPVPAVAINSTGNTTAGEMYTLSCTATVVGNLVVVPHVQWEYSNGSVVDGGPTLTLSTMATSANTTTCYLTFSPLQTSHGGEYTCRAIISIPSISNSSLNESQFSGVVVQSKLLVSLLS